MFIVVIIDVFVVVYNLVKMKVGVFVDDKDVKVEIDIVIVDIIQVEDKVQFKILEGQIVDVSVKDGDVFVLIFDFFGNFFQLKVEVFSKVVFFLF